MFGVIERVGGVGVHHERDVREHLPDRVDDLDGPWRLLGEIASAEDVPPGVRAEGFAWECPQLVLVATGSEVQLAVQAREQLAASGVRARVVSLPSLFAFKAQDVAWREAVLPAGVPRVAVEAGATSGWREIVGLDGAVVGLDTFGESAPASVLFKHFGFTAENVADTVQAALRRAK